MPIFGCKKIAPIITFDFLVFVNSIPADFNSAVL